MSARMRRSRSERVCRFCDSDGTQLVRTPGGVFRTCDEHVERIPEQRRLLVTPIDVTTSSKPKTTKHSTGSRSIEQTISRALGGK